MVSDLRDVRSQIELYKVQHLDCHPGTAADGTWAIAAFKMTLMGKTDSKDQHHRDPRPVPKKFRPTR